jgi:hypothetical protein
MVIRLAIKLAKGLDSRWGTGVKMVLMMFLAMD